MRACCVAVTSLPDASPLCISQFDDGRGAYKTMPVFPKYAAGRLSTAVGERG